MRSLLDRGCDLEAAHPQKGFRQQGMTLAISKRSSTFPEGLDEYTGLQIQSSVKNISKRFVKTVLDDLTGNGKSHLSTCRPSNYTACRYKSSDYPRTFVLDTRWKKINLMQKKGLPYWTTLS